MNHGAKLFINEILMDDMDWHSETNEMEARITTYAYMLYMSKVRSTAEHTDLVCVADKRLRFERKHCRTGSFFGFLEFTFVEFPPPSVADGSCTSVQTDYD